MRLQMFLWMRMKSLSISNIIPFDTMLKTWIRNFVIYSYFTQNPPIGARLVMALSTASTTAALPRSMTTPAWVSRRAPWDPRPSPTRIRMRGSSTRRFSWRYRDGSRFMGGPVVHSPFLYQKDLEGMYCSTLIIVHNTLLKSKGH